MEQRGVIVTAIILALVLAGGLWYSLTRTTPEVPIATTPTPTAPVVATPVPEAVLLTPNEIVAGTSLSQSVEATAASGTRENMLALLTAATTIGAFTLFRAVRAARR